MSWSGLGTNHSPYDTHSPWTHQHLRFSIWPTTMPEDVRIRFGKRVRLRRKKLNVSQEEFADMCGLDRTYVGGIERGERNLALVNIEKIARALRLSLAELFKGV
jgi:ribosome-binding protein aMBF1 (putative translation factor)